MELGLEDPGLLDADVESSLYRLAQEALTDVRKARRG